MALVLGTVPSWDGLFFILEKQFKGVVKSLGLVTGIFVYISVGDLRQVTSNGLGHIYNRKYK